MTRHGLDAPDVLEDGAWKSRRMVLRWVPNRLRNKGSERRVTAGTCDNGGHKAAPNRREPTGANDHIPAKETVIA